MTFYDKLEDLWQKKGYDNLKQFSEASCIPYNTIVSWRGKTADSIKFGTIRFLSSFFEVEWNYWIEKQEPSKKQLIFKEEEKEIIQKYRSASADIKNAVISVLHIEKNFTDASSSKEA